MADFSSFESQGGASDKAEAAELQRLIAVEQQKAQFQAQVVEDGYEFFAKRQLVMLFSVPNYCGEFAKAGAMMSVDKKICSFQILKPAEKKKKKHNSSCSMTPPRNVVSKQAKK